MKHFFGIALCFALLNAAALPAYADDERPPKELVEDLSKRAHEGFLSVKNAEGQTIVKPEDAKKLKYPLISYEEREMAVVRGHLSGLAHWCGLEWQKEFFVPYIASLRGEHKKSWTEHQYAYAEVLHGASMAVAEKGKEGQKCSAAEKQRLQQLSKK